jgi:DNA (cytosine-5)-methyltransferase 1
MFSKNQDKGVAYEYRRGALTTAAEPQNSKGTGDMNADDRAGDNLGYREKGWVYRGDRVTSRTRIRRPRTPQVSRYTRVQNLLQQDMFNSPWEFVDTSQVGTTPIFNTVDLFAGCGGLTLGFEWAGFHSLLGVELDPDAAATYRANFPDAKVWDAKIEDLSNERAVELTAGRAVHAVLAGFPCQGFSIAGQRNPKDERNVLFREVVRIAELLQPQFVVMENVPGVVTMSKGAVFKAIRDEFAEVGYSSMTTLILEAAAYEVAQFRPRAVFVANRLGVTNPLPSPVLSEDSYIAIETEIGDLAGVPRDPTINHDWTHHSPEMELRLAEVEPGGSLYDSYTDAWKRQYRGVPSMTIKENHGGTHIHYELNRTLSAREMARLQSFPDSFRFHGRMKRVMFQIGNAVPAKLAYHIALALRPTLERQIDQV